MSEHLVVVPLVRIVLVGFSGLLRDIIRGTFDEQPDMTVLAEVPDCASLQNALACSRTDLVIYGLDGGDLLEVCPQLFDEHPRIKVVTVRDDGRRGFLWELQPCSTTLGEVSPQLLVETVRKVVHQ